MRLQVNVGKIIDFLCGGGLVVGDSLDFVVHALHSINDLSSVTT